MENGCVGVVGTGVIATGTAALLTQVSYRDVRPREDYELHKWQPFYHFSTITIEE